MNSNSNSNSNTITPSTGDWKNRIPEGNWRTPLPPQMQSATAWSHQTSMKGITQTQAKFLPSPHQRKEVWADKKESYRRNKNMIITTTQTPIKKEKEFVYDMGDFPSLNPTQVGIEYTTPNKMSYANIASIPPPPQISRNLNNDFVSINIHEYNNEEEEEDYPEYDYEYETYSIRKKWDDDNDDEDDLESGSYN